jgi:hypothetical protein
VYSRTADFTFVNSYVRKGKKPIKGATPLGAGKPGGRKSDAQKGNLSDANTSGKETDSRSSTPSIQGKMLRRSVMEVAEEVQKIDARD